MEITKEMELKEKEYVLRNQDIYKIDDTFKDEDGDIYYRVYNNDFYQKYKNDINYDFSSYSESDCENFIFEKMRYCILEKAPESDLIEIYGEPYKELLKELED